MKTKKKLKLNPAARDNRRYLLIQETNKTKIENAILEYIGILGMAKSAFLFVAIKNGNLIGSCLREKLDDILASLAFAKINVFKVSGTIAGLER
jgi:RNase P/RNase MRP subunit POP5